MAKLSNNLLKYLAEHLEGSIQTSRSGRGIYFCFDTIANGECAYSYLIEASDAPYKGRDTSYGIDKRDFHVLFESRSVRDAEFKDLSEQIAGYSLEHQDEIGNKYGEDGVVDDEVGDTSDNTVIWIVAGAAVAIILVLLLWKK